MLGTVENPPASRIWHQIQEEPTVHQQIFGLNFIVSSDQSRRAGKVRSCVCVWDQTNTVLVDDPWKTLTVSRVICCMSKSSLVMEVMRRTMCWAMCLRIYKTWVGSATSALLFTTNHSNALEGKAGTGKLVAWISTTSKKAVQRVSSKNRSMDSTQKAPSR